MKVAYVFSTSGHTASYKLGKMILPQLEQGTHGVEVVGMFFFDDNTYLLRAGDPVGERLGRVAAERGMLLMLCDQCALERCLAEGEIGAARPMGTVAGVRVGWITSSLCERTELALGGLGATEPRLGEPWPSFTRSDWDGLGLYFAWLAGRLAHRRADSRERQARRLLRGGALLDERGEALLQPVGFWVC